MSNPSAQNFPIINNIKLEKIPILDKDLLAKIPAFTGIKITSELPKIPRTRIQFDLLNGSTALANAIRLTVLEEIEWKALEISPESIKTNEKNILINEFCDRISLIPINQNVPEDAVFSINVVSGSSGGSERDQIIKADKITQTGGPKFSELLCDNIRLAVLSPKRFLQVQNIRVVKGKGYLNSKFTTCTFTYEPLEYLNIRSMESYHLELSEMIKITDLVKTKDSKDSKNVAKLYDEYSKKKIIMINNPTVLEKASEETKKRINSHDIVIDYVDRLQARSSLVEDPKHFRLGFEFYNCDHPAKIVNLALVNIVERLTKIRKIVNSDGTSNNLDMVNVRLIDDKCEINIFGEDNVIAGLMRYYILARVPDIPLVNCTIKKIDRRELLLRIWHPQSIKVFHETLDSLVEMLTKINIPDNVV